MATGTRDKKDTLLGQLGMGNLKPAMRQAAIEAAAFALAAGGPAAVNMAARSQQPTPFNAPGTAAPTSQIPQQPVAVAQPPSQQAPTRKFDPSIAEAWATENPEAAAALVAKAADGKPITRPDFERAGLPSFGSSVKSRREFVERLAKAPAADVAPQSPVEPIPQPEPLQPVQETQDGNIMEGLREVYDPNRESPAPPTSRVVAEGTGANRPVPEAPANVQPTAAQPAVRLSPMEQRRVDKITKAKELESRGFEGHKPKPGDYSVDQGQMFLKDAFSRSPMELNGDPVAVADWIRGGFDESFYWKYLKGTGETLDQALAKIFQPREEVTTSNEGQLQQAEGQAPAGQAATEGDAQRLLGNEPGAAGQPAAPAVSPVVVETPKKGFKRKVVSAEPSASATPKKGFKKKSAASAAPIEQPATTPPKVVNWFEETAPVERQPFSKEDERQLQREISRMRRRKDSDQELIDQLAALEPQVASDVLSEAGLRAQAENEFLAELRSEYGQLLGMSRAPARARLAERRGNDPAIWNPAHSKASEGYSRRRPRRRDSAANNQPQNLLPKAPCRFQHSPHCSTRRCTRLQNHSVRLSATWLRGSSCRFGLVACVRISSGATSCRFRTSSRLARRTMYRPWHTKSATSSIRCSSSQRTSRSGLNLTCWVTRKLPDPIHPGRHPKQRSTSSAKALPSSYGTG
jgi:hypothetical protein